MQKKYGEQGFTVVAINLDKDRSAATRFLEQYPVPFAVAFDPAGRIAEAFHVSAMPSSFLVSPSGTILLAHTGYDAAHAGELETHIAENLHR